jgi:localization factor PodJL
MIDGIRARQRRSKMFNVAKAVRDNRMPHCVAAVQQAGFGAPVASAPRPAPASELSETLLREMVALRNEMTVLRNDARDQAFPDDLRRDLAGISASIDALGSQDSGTDSLRLELDSMRSMIERLAREESIQALENRWQTMEEQVSGLDVGGVREELVNLAYRVDDIRAALSTRPETAQVQAIENKISELAAAIEAMSRQTPLPIRNCRASSISWACVWMKSPAPSLQFPHRRCRKWTMRRSSGLRHGLRRCHRRSTSLNRAPTAVDIGARIEGLAARVAQLADEEAVARLDARIERLQSLVESGAQNQAMPDLSNHLADISGKIEALDTRGIDQSLLNRLDQLTAQIDSLSLNQPQAASMPDAVIGRLEALIGRAEQSESRNIDPLPGLETLDARLSEIAARLQQAEVNAAGHAMHPSGGLETVEAQLAEISAVLTGRWKPRQWRSPALKIWKRALLTSPTVSICRALAIQVRAMRHCVVLRTRSQTCPGLSARPLNLPHPRPLMNASHPSRNTWQPATNLLLKLLVRLLKQL